MYAWSVIFGLLTAAITLLVLFGYFDRVNIRIAEAVKALRSPEFSIFFIAITNTAGPLPVIIGTLLLYRHLVLQNRIPDSTILLTVTALTFVSYTLMKAFFQVARPIDGVISASGWAFPSGHASMATALVMTIGFLFVRQLGGPFKRSAAFFGCAAFILLVSFSRIYLGAHWLSDVLAGMTVGGFIFSSVVLSECVIRTIMAKLLYGKQIT